MARRVGIIPSPIRRAFALCGIAILATVLLVALVPTTVAAADVTRTLNIVLVGDSYSAGNGAGDYTGVTGCYRSNSNWASRYAAARRAAGQPTWLNNQACSGAVTRDYSNSQNPALRPQNVDLNKSTDMVLFTFGGNDAGFARLLAACFGARNALLCQSLVNAANRLMSDSSADGLEARITKVVQDMRSKTRADTQIVMMGYPTLISQSCAYKLALVPDAPATYDAGAAIRGLTDMADTLQRRIATKLSGNVAFVPVSQNFVSHGPAPKSPSSGCWHNPDTWLVEPGTATISVPTLYHPNPAGQAEYARLLGARFGNWTPPSWQSAPTPPPVPTPPPPAASKPVASFSYNRLLGAGNQVSLDGRSSNAPSGTLRSWEWSSAGRVIATGSTATVGFGTTISPAVTLTVIDSNGSASTVTRTLSLGNRSPSIVTTSPVEGAMVGTNQPSLSATATDPDADALTYSYRITGPLVDQQSGAIAGAWAVPAHVLDPGQAYTWSVTVTDGRGGIAIVSRKLTVAMLPTAADVVSTSSGKGYWQVASDGGVFSYGDAQFYGSVPGIPLKVTNIIGMTRTPSGQGYWVVGRDGGVFAFGDAQFHGSLPQLNIWIGNIVDMVPTKSGGGYWLVGSDGGVFSFGDAQFYGSMGGKAINAPVESISATKSGNGYWLVARDGGIFAFGDAPFYGSMGGQALNSPVVDMEVTPDGGGYWMTAEDGGVFTFGNAPFYGSMGGKAMNGHVTGMAASPTGQGYWLNGCDGGIFSFGDAPFLGSNATYNCRGVG